MERDFIALGALELSLDDITAARMRLERFTDLTPAQALNRLRMKMESFDCGHMTPRRDGGI